MGEVGVLKRHDEDSVGSVEGQDPGNITGKRETCGALSTCPVYRGGSLESHRGIIRTRITWF